ncbi:MAG: efflux RND transporter periplasmic adaptor subunit [Sedimentisphaerales bacterium]|nr:efflux RND transporter periplasmic adaptor subunit [Sedimentisphaerales bacterium]
MRNIKTICIYILAACLPLFLVVYLGYARAAGDEHDHETSQCQEDHDHEHGHDDEQAQDEMMIHLDPETEAAIGIQTAAAQRGSLVTIISLTGKIVLNEDRLAHITPYVPGIVQQVARTPGDAVQSGEVLAVLHSRELLEAKAAYLASVERYESAKTEYQREAKLWDQKIASEQDYLEGKRAFAQAEIDKLLSGQRLLALGVEQEMISSLSPASDSLLMRYELRAPIEGVIIERHLTPGEYVKDDSPVFTVADLGTVWVELDVFAKDFSLVHQGQSCQIVSGDQTYEGQIHFVSPVLDAATRTAKARVILANRGGMLKPGLFVAALIREAIATEAIVIPRDAVQMIQGESHVFVKAGQDYVPRAVALGRSGVEQVEILSGLEPGEQVVVRGAFDLKASIVTSTLDSHAGHGH